LVDDQDPISPEYCFLSDYLARICELHLSDKPGPIRHMFPLLRRLADDYWVTDEEQEFIDELSTLL
jgi:hypothetical protein